MGVEAVLYDAEVQYVLYDGVPLCMKWANSLLFMRSGQSVVYDVGESVSCA